MNSISMAFVRDCGFLYFMQKVPKLGTSFNNLEKIACNLKRIHNNFNQKNKIYEGIIYPILLLTCLCLQWIYPKCHSKSILVRTDKRTARFTCCYAKNNNRTTYGVIWKFLFIGKITFRRRIDVSVSHTFLLHRKLNYSI